MLIIWEKDKSFLCNYMIDIFFYKSNIHREIILFASLASFESITFINIEHFVVHVSLACAYTIFVLCKWFIDLTEVPVG